MKINECVFIQFNCADNTVAVYCEIMLSVF